MTNKHEITVHESLTSDHLYAAGERSISGLDCVGFCLNCGVQADGVEPDARGYACEACGVHAVFGAEEVIVMGLEAGDLVDLTTLDSLS